ncbi:MAG: HAD family hydrolase [Planctomycetota bacterium]
MTGPTIEAVIFDMDGTLVEPLLNFDAIRTELDIPAGAGILEALERMPQQQRQAARRRLRAHELAAARQAKEMPAATDTVRALQRAGVKTALLTRNDREAMETVLQRLGVSFDLAWARQDGPIKPEPDGVVRACRALNAPLQRTACVGDFRYDMIAANAAGAVSILLAPGERPDFADQADYVIRRFDELLMLCGR